MSDERNFTFGKPIDITSLVADSIAGLEGDPPWQWVSFADPDRPAGSQFLGVAIVRAWNVGHAASVCHASGCNPGGEVMALPVPEQFGAPPPEWDHRLITDKSEIERLTQSWHGSGCKTVGELENRR